jgi:photosystem II stability/assembly factor-like uncharacterized protein
MVPSSRNVRLAGCLILMVFLAAITLVRSTASAAPQQDASSSAFSALRWRLIGPFRGGRVTSVAGVPGQPSVFYMATPGGGIWKTTDAGRVWKPIFDKVPVASIGAIAVAPSDPNIIYAGTGEQAEGRGVFKSTDAGATWASAGLSDSRFISSVIVDPRDPQIVYAGAYGQIFIFGGNNSTSARGIYKTTDGGKNWNRVLFKDDKTIVMDMCMDPGNHKVLYAALWTPNFGAMGGGAAKPASSQPPPPDSIIYKSTDAGEHWAPVAGKGLPALNLGRIGVIVAPGDKGRRLYAIMNQGLFRSEDAGNSWEQITKDPRIIGNFYFSRVFVDPRNPDIVYVAQTSMYRSTDGGRTFTSFVGAPSGDDFHVMWIDPSDTQRMILGVDQGAIVSVDGGNTWGSWYNQPTAQLYHVSTGNTFPYFAYAAQQDSGTVAVPSRSDYGEISFRDWFSVAGFEAAFIAQDPLNPNLIYSEGWYDSIIRFDRTTGQFPTVFVLTSKYRAASMMPLMFSPRDPHTLYLGTQYLLETTDGGDNWKEISPDLTTMPKVAKDAKSPAPGANLFRRASAISALAPSSLADGLIWAGTSNGLIHITRNGGTNWQDVSPPGLLPGSSILTLEASHHDPGTAYAAVSLMGTSHPSILSTHDFGHSWQTITTGLPNSSNVNVVREDLGRAGLLYAGTDLDGVFVSFDDGTHWQSLQLNLPPAPVRDLALHGDDLVVATFGRSLWILDNITPLRQYSAGIAQSNVFFYQPQTAVRVRWDQNQDTPLPIETPVGQNPPDGAILDYFLKSVPSSEITLEIHDAQGNLVRRYSSTAPPAPALPKNAPDYWFAPLPTLPKNAGMNRFVWDLRYPEPTPLPYGYFGELLGYTEYTFADHAIPSETPQIQPQGPLIVPGDYEAILTVDGKTYSQKLTVKLDPRLNATTADLTAQLALADELSGDMAETYSAFNLADKLSSALEDRQKELKAAIQISSTAEAKAALAAAADFEKKLDGVQEGESHMPGFGVLNRDGARIYWMVESGDSRPVASAYAAAAETCDQLHKSVDAWQQLVSTDLPALNAKLVQAKLAAVQAPTTPVASPACQMPKSK